MGICYMAQKIQTRPLHKPRVVGWGGRWEGDSKGRGYMYTYGWFMLKLDRKQQNSVNQLSFNKKIETKQNKSKQTKKMQALNCTCTKSLCRLYNF